MGNNDNSLNLYKKHLEEGDKLTWFKSDSNGDKIEAIWHSNGRVSIGGKDDASICEAVFYAKNGKWRNNEHGCGTEASHWYYERIQVSEFISLHGKDFWRASEKPTKAYRKKLKDKEKEVEKYETITTFDAEAWLIEDNTLYKRFYKPGDIVGYLISYKNMFEYKADQLDTRMNCNGVYVCIKNNEPYYIGQGDEVYRRCRMHTEDKHAGAWDAVLLIVSEVDRFTTDLQDIIEFKLINETRNRGGKLANSRAGNVTSANKVYNDRPKYCDDILEQIRTISVKAGYTFLIRGSGADDTRNNIGTAHKDLKKDKSRTNVIATPESIVNEMISLLPESVFGLDGRILDLAVKDGGFIQKLFEKCMQNKEWTEKYTDPETRRYHIKNEKLFGVIQAATEDSFKEQIRVKTDTIISENNLIIIDYDSILNKDKCSINKAVEEIKEKFKQGHKETEDMTFDLVIGNPPYQKNTGGKSGGTAIWPMFIDMAKELIKKNGYIVMITPSRWFTGGNGIASQWRTDWMGDHHIDKLVHFPNAKDVFVDNSIAGGVSYFIWDSTKESELVQFENRGTGEVCHRKLDKHDVFIVSSIEESIVDKVIANTKEYMNTLVGSGGTYGFATNYRGTEGEYKVITSAGIQRCSKADLTKQLPVGWRTIVSNVMSEHAGESSIDGKYKVLTTVQVADPMTVTAGHYVPVGPFETEEEALNCKKYLCSKLLRILLKMRAIGIGIASDTYSFVPLQNFGESSDIDWRKSIEEIDHQLYKKYGLTEEEINYIEKTIKPMN